jgi:hypothetical protein
MTVKSPRDWNEEEIWDSLLNPHFAFQPAFATEALERWENNVGIRKEDYIKMNDAKRAIFYNDWDAYDKSTYASEPIEHLEDILKRPNIHPIQKKAAKFLRDKLKIKIIEKNTDHLHGPL